MRKTKGRICVGLAAAVLSAVGFASMTSNAVDPSSAGVGSGTVTTSTLANGSVVSTTPNFSAP